MSTVKVTFTSIRQNLGKVATCRLNADVYKIKRGPIINFCKEVASRLVTFR